MLHFVRADLDTAKGPYTRFPTDITQMTARQAWRQYVDPNEGLLDNEANTEKNLNWRSPDPQALLTSRVPDEARRLRMLAPLDLDLDSITTRRGEQGKREQGKRRTPRGSVAACLQMPAEEKREFR